MCFCVPPMPVRDWASVALQVLSIYQLLEELYKDWEPEGSCQMVNFSCVENFTKNEVYLLVALFFPVLSSVSMLLWE